MFAFILLQTTARSHRRIFGHFNINKFVYACWEHVCAVCCVCAASISSNVHLIIFFCFVFVPIMMIAPFDMIGVRWTDTLWWVCVPGRVLQPVPRCLSLALMRAIFICRCFIATHRPLPFRLATTTGTVAYLIKIARQPSVMMEWER